MISEAYNMDCMDFMRDKPDKFFDLAIVDPPYGIKINKLIFGIEKLGRVWGNSAALKKDYGKIEWDNNCLNENYFIECLRISKNQIFWGGNFYSLPISRGWIVWDKLTGSNDFGDCELAWTSFNRPIKKFKFMWNGMIQGNMKNKQERIHPSEKPYQLYYWILQNYATLGDKIFDSHLGSGSSRIAAYKLGFDFWGTELDKDYFDAAEKRFKQAINEPLFQTQPEPEQSKLFK